MIWTSTRQLVARNCRHVGVALRGQVHGERVVRSSAYLPFRSERNQRSVSVGVRLRKCLDCENVQFLVVRFLRIYSLRTRNIKVRRLGH